ncbi:MAG: D-alanyl-D-alanine carboxypeptidase [Candidatus Nitricoxidivorans perseverans]|uniref:serine-type D-Ala-D-Ala carboxypeptidase n=1 Tax=Candidatus Nitricoxidivorans perseverans TaxID=2975601 RepID=A0AA49FJP5_9PROT|nr:MAG: D-alanyl-D-alanine carboxypeptidase [Candidatus Nitricoxidivorans perseverans]
MRHFFLLLAGLLALSAQAQPAPQPPAGTARAWLLVDHASGRPLAGLNPDGRVEPASLTKLMTAYLAFSALKQGTLKPEQPVKVSEKAWQAQGSRMFIEPNRPVTVDELLRGMIVQSGNDATIALAEAIAGSEEAFVQRMNHEAARMGLSGTNFANATGLPDPRHHSTARDLARLIQALIRDFPDRYPIYALKEYAYNGIAQPNRNRLLWLDPTVDGVKTGHTETAGYCLIASSMRGPRRLTAVVLGAASDAARGQEALDLLNFGFQAFDAVKLYDGGQAISALRVFKGGQGTVKAGFLENFVLSLPKGAAGRLKAQLVSQQPLLAPVQKGERIATLRLSIGDDPLDEFPVVALEDVPIAGILGRAWDSLLLWFR